MPTTTFCDVTMTEKLENYTHENQEYTLEEGETISMPFHTANRMVNKWDIADFEGDKYEIRPEEYEDVLMRRVDTAEKCETVKSDGEVCLREKPCPFHSDE